MKEVNPKETTRAYAFDMWMKAPMPMVTFFKTLDISHLLKISRRKDMKFNMLMCYCLGRAANSAGEVSSCDIPFNKDLQKFNDDYLRLTRQVAESCIDHDLSQESMVIGTSALAHYEIDGAVGMYSGIFNNPFIIWGKYKRSWLKTTLTLSFQFHHTQMDGAHAAHFLDTLQRTIKEL